MRLIVLIMTGLGVAGCSPNTTVSQQMFGSSQVMVAPGNLRLVTERRRDGHPAVVCTEPSPDYALAFTTKADLTVKTTPGTGPQGDVAGKVERSETVTEGKGREAAVLALRDGLYAACQAYANGVIGYDAYSLILSQYGALLAAIVQPPQSGARSYSNDGLAALVTACVSTHDPTRQPAARNALLDIGFCREVLRRVGRAR
ncbi:MAG TPA: hypothetical protein VIL72_00560 [Beijerinckiaceae bacterium]|jgi:hypothetical protein